MPPQKSRQEEGKMRKERRRKLILGAH